MRNLHVTIWQVNTRATQYLDLHTRLAYLYKTVDQAYAYLRNTPASKHRVRGVFVAPEYYFAAHSAGGHHELSENRYLTADEVNDINASLACLSQIYPGLLLIPGTVLWKKPVGENTSIENKSTVVNPEIHHIYSSYDPATLKLLSQTLGELFDAETQEALQRCDAIKSTETIDCHSVQAYLNGKHVYQSDRCDDLDNTINTAPILNSSPVFEVDGLRFGIEIFLDHAYNALKTPVDVHIILSNCVRRQQGKGKYVIYVSSRAEESGAWKAVKGKYHKLNCHVANEIMDYKMETA